MREKAIAFIKFKPNGYDEARSDADGIIRVGVIPFMLDETILKGL